MAGRNRLAAASSPYLQQHADNPVAWNEWGGEAFAEARERDVPVFLSVGYAACHWCHVMAHESFEDDATAELLNAGFVCVKVDREERPDVDAVYMAATQAMTGQGGWPMSVMLTPDGAPFFAGTYFPSEPRHGMPSFRQVLEAVSAAWRDRRDELEQVGADVTAHLQAAGEPTQPASVVDDPQAWHAIGERALGQLSGQFDRVAGGFGGAPKFPPAMVVEFLLRKADRGGDPRASSMAERTLTAMARGGIYDQIGGGFARYSVDSSWAVPHFEKMLYDNAQLLDVYVHWLRSSGSELARRVVREMADFVLRELSTPEGGLASSLDADSDGREGAFYIWTPSDLEVALGPDDAAWAAEVFGVAERGNVEGDASTLRLVGEAASDPDPARLDRVRGALLAARAGRTRPGRDDKVVAAWNGLGIGALARAAVALGDREVLDAAVAAATLLLDVHLRADGSLARVSRDGVAGAPDGLLEDAACVGSGLLALFAVTGDQTWYRHALALTDQIERRFVSDGVWFDTANDADPLVVRPRDAGDNVTPSGQTAAAVLLTSVAALTGDTRRRDAAAALVTGALDLVGQAPRMAGGWLSLVEALADGPVQVAVVGAHDDPATRALVSAALALRHPGAVVAQGSGDPSDVPLLAHRVLVDGRPAGYLCHDFVCDLPVTDPVGWR